MIVYLALSLNTFQDKWASGLNQRVANPSALRGPQVRILPYPPRSHEKTLVDVSFAGVVQSGRTSAFHADSRRFESDRPLHSKIGHVVTS